MDLEIGGTTYMLTPTQASSPALEVEKDGEIGYGFLSNNKPETPTIGLDALYLNQPRVPFTITLPISLSVGANGTVYSSYLSQLKVYSASWSFSGSARQNESEWMEASWSHGYVYGGSTSIYDIGHQHERDTGWKSLSGSGVLKADSLDLANVSQRMKLHGVDIYQYTTGNEDNERTVTVSPTTYLTGTLTITGYKLP